MEQFEKAQKKREALFAKTKDMTPEERREYLKENREELKNPLTQLVTDGVITQERPMQFVKCSPTEVCKPEDSEVADINCL